MPDREYQFHPERRWRVDFAWPEFWLLVEVEGITPAGGRHQRVAGFEADAEKYGEAQRLGWTVLRLSPTQVRTGAGVRLITDLLRRLAWQRQP
ncbi:MAG: endonuclease domain-containing protein [Thermoanaerobaculaceae bacterium]|nr:endonuclease domain-containing protein [Thermoanaerobaculaceae bacterium]